jgi:AT-binding transcription factor 1
MKHLQMEQIHQLQRRSEGKELQTDIGEVFQVISQLDPSGFGDGEPGKATELKLVSYIFTCTGIRNQ